MLGVYVKALQKAEDYDGLWDIGHDLSHSERVFKNAKIIAENIGYTDLDTLKVCAYWHDTGRTKAIDPHEEAGGVMARDYLLSIGATEEVATKIYEGIRYHSSHASPITIEGKIIRDADKLDIYSVERWKKIDKSGWTRVFSDDLRQTLNNLNRYPAVFTYDITKELFTERLPGCLKYWESVKSKLV